MVVFLVRSFLFNYMLSFSSETQLLDLDLLKIKYSGAPKILSLYFNLLLIKIMTEPKYRSIKV